ncbi:hypothetical protein ZEAMMB73_Zm00001d034370 [Zea mays]|uniref:MD-2-related lipid-recognition domain-containing protein n=1 Tax=Zea mays TaxID=4577 RepID=A0A1D6L6Y7_MAIZE|nr:hypothetical protein ZEAMMB73_Zm00001d034370 [Zea mays]ONM10057.1 hypothetical protein ZEAMMB73_Zm00001d034370 [Zea mays]ONM10060.1 hypothetical protein ZEAMMB73_Zm00001d034370 [Zea mays]
MAPKHLNLFAAALLLLLLPSGSSATAVEYCKKGWDYPVKVSSVEVVPDPVVRGQPATFKISASTGNQSVLRLRGSYTLTMKLLGDSNEELTCISFGFSIGFVAPNPVI